MRSALLRTIGNSSGTARHSGDICGNMTGTRRGEARVDGRLPSEGDVWEVLTALHTVLFRRASSTRLKCSNQMSSLSIAPRLRRSLCSKQRESLLFCSFYCHSGNVGTLCSCLFLATNLYYLSINIWQWTLMGNFKMNIWIYNGDISTSPLTCDEFTIKNWNKNVPIV